MRCFTDSFASMAFTEKCLPMSRRKSKQFMLPNQLALFSMMAGFAPSNFKNGVSWFLMLSTQLATVSGVFRLRSTALKLGSPIMPVAPPTSATGVCPAFWKRRNTNTGNKCPMCRLSAVGSKPQ